MTVADMIQVKRIERALRRRLTPKEVRGEAWIRLPMYGSVKITQVSLQWLHNTNSCK